MMRRAPTMYDSAGPPLRKSRAFSLLEVLVAIALLGILLGSVYAFITTLFDREARSLDEANRSQVATMIFDRLEADLMSAVASAPSGVGVDGTRDRLRITHRAVLPGSAEGPGHDLQVTTIRFEPPRIAGDALGAMGGPNPIGGVGGLEGIGGIGPGGPGMLDAEIGSDRNLGSGAGFGSGTDLDDASRPGRLTLERRAAGARASQALGDGDSEPYPVPIRAARFRYHDGDAWASSYRSDRAMPVAIELAIWFGNPATSEDAGSSAGMPGGSAGGGGAVMDAESGLGAGFGPGLGTGLTDEGTESLEDLGQPDRVRLITIPDARLPRAVATQLDMGGMP